MSRNLVAIGTGPSWCDPPCILPFLHHGDCWDGTHCERCPIGCHYCDGAGTCPCLVDHSEDDV